MAYLLNVEAEKIIYKNITKKDFDQGHHSSEVDCILLILEVKQGREMHHGDV